MTPASQAHRYDADFFDWVDSGAFRSARALLPLVQRDLAPSSVLDCGCGRGTWLRVWNELGLQDYCGVDGAYALEAGLQVTTDHFVAHDLREPLALARRFDLVQSFEVAEHLPEDKAEAFVDMLTTHGDKILFSAATPGQGGENHINEQPLSYWRAKFAARGYVAFDPYRAALCQNAEVEPWYAFNTLLYVKESLVAGLPETVRQTRLADGAPIPSVEPASWRVRKAVLRCLPVFAVTLLSRLVYQLRTRARTCKKGCSCQT